MHLAILGAVLIVIALIAAYAVVVDVPPVPSNRKARAAMLGLIPADFAGTAYDLGSGWGTLAVRIARRWPKATVIGIELSPIPWLVAKVRAKIAGVTNLQLVRDDMFRRPLTDADLAVCYLLTPVMTKLAPKLAAELPSGSIVISNTFALPDRAPATVVQVDDMHYSKVYLYRF